MELPNILIAGRANVGKSTLFNRLATELAKSRAPSQAIGKAIVSARAGATRDMMDAEIYDDEFGYRIIDGAGWSERPQSALQKVIAEHSRKALAAIDGILFVYDAKAGVLPEDKALADFFRKLGKPIILVANKCEAEITRAAIGESYALGLGEPVIVSSQHGYGLYDLYGALRDNFSHGFSVASRSLKTSEKNEKIRICILGRPNVGKSTLVNWLLGEEKALVADISGLTRDAVEYPLSFGEQEFLLVDTAGLRKPARIHEDLEKLSTSATLTALRYSHVAILVVDASRPLHKQDLRLAKLIADEGRAPLIAANKWDLVTDEKARLGELSEKLASAFAQVKAIRLLPLSARDGGDSAPLWRAVSRSYTAWNKRISTAVLNRHLADWTSENPPPLRRGKRLKIRYMTQVATRPPTFAVFTSQADSRTKDGVVPTQYMRYLRNRLQAEFGLSGVPMRLRTAR